MTKYFTSDTHFAHPFVAALRGYAKPGFRRTTIKQQANEAHMQVKDCVNWYQHDMDVTDHINEMVGENDELYILGDLCSGGAWSLQQALMHVKSLRCPRNNRHLILGNHSERAEKARWVLLHANMNRLVYTRKAFNERGVDMEYVGDLLSRGSML